MRLKVGELLSDWSQEEEEEEELSVLISNRGVLGSLRGEGRLLIYYSITRKSTDIKVFPSNTAPC